MKDSGNMADRRLGSLIAGLLGFLFLAVYGWLEGLLPRGAQEFAYFPFMSDPLPFAPMRGFTFEQLARHVLRTFVLGFSLACLVLGIGGVWRAGPPRRSAFRSLLICVVGGSVVLTAVVMATVLEGRAIVDDELVYRQQAELLVDGRLTENSVPPWGWEVFTIWTQNGATGKYLPGEPLVQTFGTLLNLPAFAHLLLAALALMVWYRVVQRDAGSEVALWATILIAVSPMFILTNALALSHTTTLTCLILAGLGYQWARDDRPLRGAILSGSALGFGLMVRPQVIVPFGMVLGLATLYGLVRRRRWTATVLLIASGSLWLVGIALYNRALSGNPLTLPWYLFKPVERFGFGHVGGVEFVHTGWTALENLLVVLVQFNGWWLGWPLSLILIFGWLVLGRPRKGAWLWLAGSLALVLMNVPYYSTGISDTGPIYYFELLLPAAILGAHAITRAYGRWPAATSAFLVVHFALATTSFLAENIARLDRLVTTIHAPVEAILEKLEPPALLIHENHWTESTRAGWVWSFPARFRHESDPIVTYPRGFARFLPALIKRYEYRECWYTRIDPITNDRQLYRCEDAMDLMLGKRSEGPSLRFLGTAERLGFIGPEDTYFMQRLERKRAADRAAGELPRPR